MSSDQKPQPEGSGDELELRRLVDGQAVIPIGRVDGVIFDMDGVVTDTAKVHAGAWKQMFDEYLRQRTEGTDEAFVPFDSGKDYLLYVDGKSRYDGARAFLDSRHISLPFGTPQDPPEAQTVSGLANRKDKYFMKQLETGGADAYTSTIRLVSELQKRGLGIAIISASRNMKEVLHAADVADLFDEKVDGRDAAELGLRGKPDPAVFLEAAKRLGVHPSRAVVVEDALAGVEAARRGGFGLVIGVDRVGQAEALRNAGADVVVKDLAEVTISEEI
jgi:beta-phosphoglucomutase family hydrolase